MKKAYLKELIRETVKQVLTESKSFKLSNLTFEELEKLFPKLTDQTPVYFPDPEGEEVGISTEERFNAYKAGILRKYLDPTFEIDPTVSNWANQIKVQEPGFEEVEETLQEGAVEDTYRNNRKKVAKLIKDQPNHPQINYLKNYLKIDDLIKANRYWIDHLKHIVF